MQEVEIKILDVNAQNIRRILKKNNATFVKKVFQKNYGYSNSDSLRQGTIIRIREEGKSAVLTVKGPAQVIRGHKVRAEHELEIIDSVMIKKMLQTLGYTISMYCEMKREYYKLYGCSVEIIKFPKVPDYIEIEGTEKNIERIAKLLGYSQADYCAKSIFEAYRLRKNSFKFSS